MSGQDGTLRGEGREETSHVDHTIKLLLVGDSGVGKSSLLLRFCNDTFEELPRAHSGIEDAAAVAAAPGPAGSAQTKTAATPRFCWDRGSPAT